MFHTKLQHKMFVEKYGEWLLTLNTFRLGHKKVLLVPLSDLLHQLLVLVAVFGF